MALEDLAQAASEFTKQAEPSKLARDLEKDPDHIRGLGIAIFDIT
jgi:hypothetical protein